MSRMLKTSSSTPHNMIYPGQCEILTVTIRPATGQCRPCDDGSSSVVSYDEKRDNCDRACTIANRNEAHHSECEFHWRSAHSENHPWLLSAIYPMNIHLIMDNLEYLTRNFRVNVAVFKSQWPSSTMQETKRCILQCMMQNNAVPCDSRKITGSSSEVLKDNQVLENSRKFTFPMFV